MFNLNCNNKYLANNTIGALIIAMVVFSMLSVGSANVIMVVNNSIIGSSSSSIIARNTHLDLLTRSTGGDTTSTSNNNNQQSTIVTTGNPGNNNQNESFIVELRDKKRKERLSLIKSSLLSQLRGNSPNGNQHHHQHSYHIDSSVSSDHKITSDHPCYLTDIERNILSDIFVIIKKIPDGTIDVNQFLTNQKIIDKIQGIRPEAWICVRNAIFTSTDHQQQNGNSINSTLPSRSPSPLSTLFGQSVDQLTNKTGNYNSINDNTTQQLILEQRQRRKQERLAVIQQQILSRLGLTQRTNDTLSPCKLTDSERALIDSVFNGKSSSESNSNQLTQSNIVFTKLQGFYPSCKLNLIPNQSNNSIVS